ncbi:hypothetical protein BU16DRAFT_20840 [Lophium mytilinum]|uniref:Uncharacterized protein n=1 Tax=Lophium mytilinum TaxID=390894 RepID=A0A6A6RGL7_9PEZI|nr:hypothetical protein BU16DRAFT_20840 [Lophium mytilinum]
MGSAELLVVSPWKRACARGLNTEGRWPMAQLQTAQRRSREEEDPPGIPSIWNQSRCSAFGVLEELERTTLHESVSPSLTAAAGAVFRMAALPARRDGVEGTPPEPWARPWERPWPPWRALKNLSAGTFQRTSFPSGSQSPGRCAPARAVHERESVGSSGETGGQCCSD